VADNSSVAASTSKITITAATTPVTVTLTSPATFPALLYTNSSLSVTATIANDVANGGIRWSCSPGNTPTTCGAFSSGPNPVASGTAVTYTAPSGSVSAVTITATSVDEPSALATSPSFTINLPSGIAVGFTTAPPASLVPGGSAVIAATVTGDPANAGVNWSCSPALTCGSFNPTPTASGSATTYTASGTTGNVVISATSFTDHSQTANANINITSAASRILNSGNYTFWLSGWDFNGSPYYLAGAFTVSTSGDTMTLTAGEQDFVDYYYVLPKDSLTGSIAATADGNLQITLNTGDVCLGPGANYTCTQAGSSSAGTGVEILNAALTSSSSALLAEFDAWATASGGLEPQSAPTTTPLGGYAFSVEGWDTTAEPLAIGGVLDVDSSGGISGSGSVFDYNDFGSILSAQTLTSSSVAPAPDAFGRVTFSLNPSNLVLPEVALVGYFVDSSQLHLVETNDNLIGTTGGQAFVQTGTGGFTTGSFEGASYVFAATGIDNTNYVLQTAGALTGDSDGSSVRGNVSFNDLVNISPPGGAAIGAGTYSVDPTGRVTLTNITDSTNSPTFTYNFELYLDGNGHARMISLDSNDVVEGLADLQNLNANSAFTGTFAMGAVGADSASEDELDAVGQIISDPSAGTFSAFADLNWIFRPAPGPDFADAPVSGTFVTPDSAGAASGNVTGIDVISCPLYAGGSGACTTPADSFTYYIVDSATVLGIEDDGNQLDLIRLELQQ
jgi:hypothetical protein